jgi:hypothetical protein
VDRAVVETLRAQDVEVGRAHRVLVVRQLHGEGAQRGVGGGEVSARPIRRQRVHQRVGRN